MSAQLKHQPTKSHYVVAHSFNDDVWFRATDRGELEAYRYAIAQGGSSVVIRVEISGSYHSRQPIYPFVGDVYTN